MKALFALDTETTGLDPHNGDRIIEIGVWEVTARENARQFHRYIRPGNRQISEEASAVHGLTNDKLADAPLFEDIVDHLVDFLGDADLVIHNAPFDIAFLTAEFEQCNRGLPDLTVIDTLQLAIREFPGSRHSLDALCRRFGVDLSVREKHGALTDAKLLAQVYQVWRGQASLDLIGTKAGPVPSGRAVPREFELSEYPLPFVPAPDTKLFREGI